MFWLIVLLLIILGLIFLCNTWLERVVTVIILVVAVCLFKGWDLLDLWLALIDVLNPIFKLAEKF